MLLFLATANADVGGVTSDLPWFTQGDELEITVSAEDDDGDLTIISNLSGSELTVIECDGIGNDQVDGECDTSGDDSVDGQGTEYITIDTDNLDDDDESELLTVTLRLEADCEEATIVTISANQPGNVGPDDVTINCIPPTPRPTRTPTRTPTPVPTITPMPTMTPPPTVTPVQQVLQQVSQIITPPSTGDAGLAR
jgi:hypothetical protein